MTHLLDIAHSFGPWIALCAVLLWYIFWLIKHAIVRELARESSLVSRIEQLEADYRQDLRSALRQAATALDINSKAFDRVADAMTSLCNALSRCPGVAPDLEERLHHLAELRRD